MKGTCLVFVFTLLSTIGVLSLNNFVHFRRLELTCPSEHAFTKNKSPSRTACLLQCKTEPLCGGVSYETEALVCIKCSTKYISGSNLSTNASASTTAIFYQLQANAAGTISGNFSYTYVDDKMNWHDAKQNCESLGGSLLSIKSKEEQIYLEQINESHEFGVWLGGKGTVGIASSFQWVDGTYLTSGYENWDDSEPKDDAIRECVKSGVISENRWRAKDCAEEHRSICKFI